MKPWNAIVVGVTSPGRGVIGLKVHGALRIPLRLHFSFLPRSILNLKPNHYLLHLLYV